MERKTSYDDSAVVIYTKNKHITNEDRQKAIDIMLETGRPVIMRARREGFLRRMYRKLMGEES